jgi:aminoglycoside phosphotransferase
MLTPADQRIVARDESLPGLAIALDPTALGALIGRHYQAARGQTLRVNYLRYKPGASCIAGFEVESDHGPVLGYFRALPAERWLERTAMFDSPESALLEPGVAAMPDSCGEVYILPNDAELSGARRLLAANTRTEVLSRFVRKRPELMEAPLTILRYKPERRLVVRLGGDDGLVIKCYTEEGFARAAGPGGGFSRTEALRLPRLRGASVSRAMLAWDWVAGETLGSRLQSGGRESRALGRLAEALVSLHGQSIGFSARYQPCMVASDAALVAADLAGVLPELGQRAAELTAELTARLAAIDPISASLHGDLSADQVIVGPDRRITLIDFDRAAAGHPAYDLATFAARLVVSRHPRSREISDRLVEAYEDAGGVRVCDAMPAFLAAAIVLLSTEPFRRRLPDWPARTESLLAAAGELLSHARSAA